jgi:hypothetical protein
MHLETMMCMQERLAGMETMMCMQARLAGMEARLTDDKLITLILGSLPKMYRALINTQSPKDRT